MEDFIDLEILYSDKIRIPAECNFLIMHLKENGLIDSFVNFACLSDETKGLPLKKKIDILKDDLLLNLKYYKATQIIRYRAEVCKYEKSAEGKRLLDFLFYYIDARNEQFTNYLIKFYKKQM